MPGLPNKIVYLLGINNIIIRQLSNTKSRIQKEWQVLWVDCEGSIYHVYELQIVLSFVCKCHEYVTSHVSVVLLSLTLHAHSAHNGQSQRVQSTVAGRSAAVRGDLREVGHGHLRGAPHRSVRVCEACRAAPRAVV